MSDQNNATVFNTDLATAVYRLAVVILLAGILIVQWQSLGRTDTAPDSAAAPSMGPTFGEWRSAQTQQARQQLINQMPLVRMHGGFIHSGGTVVIDSASVAQIRRGP